MGGPPRAWAVECGDCGVLVSASGTVVFNGSRTERFSKWQDEVGAVTGAVKLHKCYCFDVSGVKIMEQINSLDEAYDLCLWINLII